MAEVLVRGNAAMARDGVAGGPEAQGWWTSAKLTIGGPFLIGPSSEAIGSKDLDGGLGGLIARRKKHPRKLSAL